MLVFALISRASTPVVFAVFGHPEHETLAWWILRAVIVAVSVTLAVWVTRRWIDRRGFAALGLRWDGRAVSDILAGFVISALMLAVAVGTFATFGHVDSRDRFGVRGTCYPRASHSPLRYAAPRARSYSP